MTASIPSGLALIQFSEPPSAEVRAQLAARGVELLAAVPESAFVARVRGKEKSWVRSLPGVEWVGPYKPEHKIEKGLAKRRSKPGVESVRVRILLAPGTSDSEREAARKTLDTVEQDSTLSFGTIIKGRLNAARLNALQESEAVLWIEPADDMKLFDESSSKIVAGDGGVNLLYSQSLGYDGSGVTVAVADSGLNNGDAESMHPDLFGRTPAFFYYGSSGQLEDAADEHSHGTHVAGIIAGNGAAGEMDENGMLYGLGVAPGAKIVAQRIFDGAGNYAPPPSFERMTRDARGAGAEIGSNSWGDDTQGRYDLSAAEFDALVRDCDTNAPGDQAYILEFSAGNAGPGAGTIGSPAVGKNVIATGASQSDRIDFIIYGDGPETMADFSSRGPCADGRIKPDIVAPGTYIASLQSASATDEYAWAAISENYQYQGGTSQAGPHASGAAAVFVQYYRENYGHTPSPALVKAALINSAVDLFDEYGTEPVPNMDEGWGRLDLTGLLDPGLQCEYVDQTTALVQSQVYETSVILKDAEAPLKATLAYTDVPGLPIAEAALVNDLDLEVVAPDGAVYRGNQFLHGESIRGAAQGDRINNVEGVLISAPIPGEYVIRVRAHSILSDARRDTGPIDQDFALVTSGEMVGPGEGVISTDRQAYRSPDTIKLLVADKDLAGVPTVTVAVASGTELGGEQVILYANGPRGAFTGVVQTAAGPAVADSRLQVVNGDLIIASYFDISASVTRTVQARVDLVPPVLSNVSSDIEFGVAHVSWTSSEPATSVVYFGTNKAALAKSALDPELTEAHSVALGRVIPGSTNYYYVVSSDEAGNLTTNDNNGEFFNFIVDNLSPLLLVDTWDPQDWTGHMELTGYTEALDQLGIPYDIWEQGSGSPAGVLASYRAVIWRVQELDLNWNAPERVAISNYLHSGGALMVASMELLTRLRTAGADGFIREVLHVADFRNEEEGSEGVAEIYGEALDPLGQGFSAVLDYTAYEEMWILFGGLLGDISDTIMPDQEASTFLYDELGDSVGLRWPGLGTNAPGRLVLLSFPFDTIPMEGADGNRVTLLDSIMSFLAPGASRYGSVRFDAAAYRLPSRINIELGDSDLAAQNSVELTVRSSSQPGGVLVTLNRNGAAGQFAGTIELVSSLTPGPGQLRAANGDEITTDYFDASTGLMRTARAMVDTDLPVIFAVAAEPDYVDAVVRFETSEPASSTVLFGESLLLGRTAHSASLETSHEITLSPLVPERTYYYKVVGRDAAGNMAETNDAAQFFTFNTKTPIHPPWSDSMDNGAGDWTTYTDSELVGMGGSDWTLGAPSNGFEESPHSLPHCWGTNLRNEPMDISECLLISPAIYISSGGPVTLKFWHNYEFNDYSGFDLESGALQISVNNGPVQDLIGYSDSSYGWGEETVDLTPYAGKMVVLIWHYLLFGFEYGPRPGWLVDDVSISAQPFIMITNNIWQGEFTLSGPVSRTGSGMAIITNPPAGQYVVQFSEVPYYNVPASQTNMLMEGGNLVFAGNYSFADVNANGISDAWETAFFKTVDTGRTANLDTDGDSMSDYAEFVAGTDPTGPTRPFVVSARRAGDFLVLEWPSRFGETYTVESSTNLSAWASSGLVLQATSAVSVAQIPLATFGRSFFRVVSSETVPASTLPERLQVHVEKLSGGAVRLTWPSPNHRGYLVESSTNLRTWTPASQWTRATETITTHTIPGPMASRMFYRVQVQP